MASITPFISTSNSEQSTTTWDTLVDSTESIAGASLANGVDYLVLYSIAYGGSDTASKTSVVVLHGENIIAKGRDESDTYYTTSMAMTGHNLCGYYVITGDGSNALKIQFRAMSSGDTGYIKGSTLIAIPLDDLAEDADYFYAQQNGDTYEQTTSSATVEVLGDVFAIPEDGPYLVLASMEAGISSGGANTEGYMMELQLGAVTQKQQFVREYEDPAAAVSFSYARIHALTSGDSTFALRGGVGQGTTAVRGFRRGRIFLFNLTSFDQYDNDVDLSSDSETEVTTSYPTYTDLLTSGEYTPAQEEYVLVLGNVMSRSTSDIQPQMSRIKNETDTSYFADFISTSGHDEEFDISTLTPMCVEQISTGKVYKLQVSGRLAASYSHYFSYPDLIILSLTTAGAGGSYTKTLTETAIASAWRDEGGSSYSITLEEGASASHAITIPSGPVYYVNEGTGDDNWDGRDDTFQGSGVGPWRTLQHAADNIPPAAIVYVADGNYTGLALDRHVATAASPTQFIASGSSVIVDVASSGWKHPFFYITFCEYVTFDGFIIDGTDYVTAPLWEGQGYVIESCIGIVIDNHTIQNIPNNAVYAAESSYITTKNTEMISCSEGASDHHTVYYARCLGQSNLVIQNCRFRDTESGSNSIQINANLAGSGSGKVTDCLIDGNEFGPNENHRINLMGVQNSRITNNLMYDMTSPEGSIRFFAETISAEQGTQPSSYNVLANNTILNSIHSGPTFSAPQSGGAYCVGNVVFNNIVIPKTTAFAGEADLQFISSNNITGVYSTFDFDSMFVDHSNEDYHILETGAAHEPPTGLAAYLGKPAPSTDIEGITRPQGSFFDIGAYEVYHSTGPEAKTLTETGISADTQSGRKWLSRELTETAVATQTYDRVGTIFRRVLSEVARTIETLWAITAEKPAQYFIMLFSEVGRGAATLARVLTNAREHTETAVASDTLDRTGTIISRIHAETALGDDTGFESESPGPGGATLVTVGYVTNGTVEVETG